jgi:hypothetical protein
MSQIARNILTQKMTRREFLIRLGAVALSVSGIAGAIRILSDKEPKNASMAYGSSTYGGVERPMMPSRRRFL